MALADILAHVRRLLRADAQLRPPAQAPRLDDVPPDWPQDDPLDPRDPFEYAAQVAAELERLKALCLQEGRPEFAERLDCEIHGYPDYFSPRSAAVSRPETQEELDAILAAFDQADMRRAGLPDAPQDEPAGEKLTGLEATVPPAKERPPAQIATPSYRTVDGQLRGEISDEVETRPLPASFAGPHYWHTPLGLLRLREIPGLVEALQEGQAYFVIPLDDNNYVLNREFATTFPDSGYAITQTWLRVPVASVHKFIDKVAGYARTLAASAGNKPPWM
ncbi:hypothetical protein HHL11_26765 [Ramlibacter sp. G-1-2-2]|uniref:Uncharacterized protein n=1 Tax=Ramlibacter agri TaxID=2728837 RepID=A0A848HD32_9BURK|nr:hypothetical protein [Ramlibacter agri]NML47380.1 hypothetical protein [Ramlibacter agri]